MKASFKPINWRTSQAGKKAVAFLLVFLFLFTFFKQPARAQLATAEAASVPQTIKMVLDKTAAFLNKILGKAGSIAFNQMLRQTLNKLSYDAANFLGAGAFGQKPLYITQDWGEYWKQVGDEAAGSFIEGYVNNLNFQGDCQKQLEKCGGKCLDAYDKSNGEVSDVKVYDTCMVSCQTKAASCGGTSAGANASTTVGGINASAGASAGVIPGGSFNVCSPSSLEAKIKIGLGLVEQNRPQAPNCTASNMVKSWGEAGGDLYKKLTDYSDPNFLNNFKGYFEPSSNDLGIFLSARTDMAQVSATAKANSTAKTTANRGWLDVRNIAKSTEGPPEQAKTSQDKANAVQAGNIGKTTGDIFIDAANILLNQLAMSLFDNLMKSLSKKSGGEAPGGGGGEGGSTKSGYTNDPNIAYGEPQIQEITAKLLQPTFGIQADYDVLAQLAVCPDPQNPGPTNCVIDNQFMQAAAEKKTVAEALAKGYLHGDWQFSMQTGNNNYSLRNVSILRQYRIVPVGWEEAIKKAALRSKKVTLNDLVSCFDQNDQYSQFSTGFDTRDQSWCQGLVDPNWVIKAPLNYCARQGAGYINAKPVISPGVKGQGGAPDVLSVINISRADDYCGDLKSCIKENKEGTCDAYGYCNEERRIWSFGDESCDPIYNTCQTFTNSENNQAVSYLQNTLVYAGCDADNAGCRQYSWLGDYATSSGAVSWDENKSLYLNRKASVCSDKGEGCSSLIRVKPTWGANLVMDSGFSQEEVGASSTGAVSFLGDWPIFSSGADEATRKATIVNASADPGGASGKALKLEIGGNSGNQQIVLSVYSDASNSVLPDNLQTIPGQSYTLSADIYFVSGSHVYVIAGDSSEGVIASSTVKNKWQHMTVTRQATNTFNQAGFDIHADSNNGDPILFYVKNIKFEMSDWDTGYSQYSSSQITEKLLPPYLEKTCYMDATSATKDYRFRPDAPSVCYNYARRCNQEEVGCEMYQSVFDGFQVPAQVYNNDYCPSQCVGYDVYISRPNYFNSPQAENLIPSTAKTCTAEAVGCSEFTNLDAAKQGGEKKEYYTYLKQCIRPSQAACANFYSWAGTGNGYQLLTSNLKKDASGNPEATPGGAPCDEAIYNLPLSDPGYNPDCQRFYSAGGQVSYRLISHTITCSDNCRTYRLSENNIDSSLNSSASCLAAGGYWEATQSNCVVCLNGGTWDNNLKACTYQAIPGEGKTCQAAQKGCREYNGPSGSNVKLSAFYDFENGLGGWYSNCTNAVTVSTVSNNKDGHSLKYSDSNVGSCPYAIGEDSVASVSSQPLIRRAIASANVAAQVNVSGAVKQGAAYNLKFLARAANNTNLNIYFYNKDNQANQRAVYFGNATSSLIVRGGNEWQLYQVSLDELSHSVGPKEVLVITADADFYMDNFVLSEITDRYYLIKGSSVIPDSCQYDIFGTYQGADYNLGCAQYTDRDNLTHNLHRFTQLCADSSVGCEQMIDTRNYSPYRSGIWKDTNNNGACDSNEPDCVLVPGDQAIYAIYDKAKLCNSDDAGCRRLGQKQSTGDWIDTYLKNDPNNYDKTLCEAAGVGCSEWINSNGGSSYFKDPGNNACVYRASSDSGVSGKNWYKVPVMRCDLNSNGKIDTFEQGGSICQNAADCRNNKTCIKDNNDYLCSVSYDKTIGLGGGGNQIPTPDNAAGICSANTSGCTEYIDPVSSFMPNLVYNANYQGTANGSHEGWGQETNETWNNAPISPVQQVINLTPNKLYIFSTISDSGNNPAPVFLRFVAPVRPLLIDNNLGTSTNTLTIPAGPNKHITFNSLSNYRILVDGGAINRTVEVKEVAIGYQIESKVDKKSCNGLVNFDKGCVLFNERSVGSSGLVSLANGWDANVPAYNQAPTVCDSAKEGSCNANQLIKVSPDRVCNKWLDCVTYVQDPVTKKQTCYAVGQCSRLNDKGECANFDNTPAGTPRSFNPSSDKNATGYSLVGNYYIDKMVEVGLNSDAHFDFEDSVPALSCKRDGTSTPCIFNKNIAKDSLVREPEGAPTDYPAHGKTYLKVPSGYLISPQSISSRVALVPNTQYYLNLLINTKNSGVGSKVIIRAVNKSGVEEDLKIYTDTAKNGWERKVYTFPTLPATSPSNFAGVKIYLGSDTPNQQGYVYFDDINIEPVLQISPEQFATRECRLYPTSDSLTCTNKNNNTISNGWEGYCLQHDQSNPNNCLLWYPVDNISSSRTQSPSFGYQGNYPLNYCSEVNGDFSLLEKRAPKLAGVEGCWSGSSDHGMCFRSGAYAYFYGTNQPEYEMGSWAWNNSPNFAKIASPSLVQNFCGPNAIGNYFVQQYCHGYGDGDNPGYYSYICIPAFMDRGPSGNWNNSFFGTKIDEAVVVGNHCQGGNGGETKFNGYSAWFSYNGLDNNIDSPKNFPIHVNVCGVSNCGDTPARYNFDESKNADPPVRVYDFKESPPDEDSLKLVYGTDSDQVYRLGCNNFVQTVDSAGLNFAWAGRTSINSADPLDTPAYFVTSNNSAFYKSTPYSLMKYGRNRETIPFGAATWPDDFDLLSSGQINLKDQLTKKNREEVFAGRPFGCNSLDFKSNGCSSIGYCSLDPNIFCLYGSSTTAAYDVNRKSCDNGKYGQCLALWNNQLSKNEGGAQPDYKNILKTIFLKSYSSYKYDYSQKTYIPASYDYDDIAALPNCGASRPLNFSTPTTASQSFCAVWPKINNVKLYFGDSTDFISPSGVNSYNIDKKGIYRLEFNTTVDSEQQPLREIRINWGYNQTQVITGQDHHPAAATPHVFYHYYSQPNINNIEIEAYDNWGFFGQYP